MRAASPIGSFNFANAASASPGDDGVNMHAALERRSTGAVVVAEAAVVEGEEHLAAHLARARASPRFTHRFAERRERPRTSSGVTISSRGITDRISASSASSSAASAAASFTSSCTIIGTWPGCCSDHSPHLREADLQRHAVARVSTSAWCITLNPGSCIAGSSGTCDAERDRQAGVQELAALRIGPHVELDRADAELDRTAPAAAGGRTRGRPRSAGSALSAGTRAPRGRARACSCCATRAPAPGRTAGRGRAGGACRVRARAGSAVDDGTPPATAWPRASRRGGQGIGGVARRVMLRTQRAGRPWGPARRVRSHP